MQVDEIACLFYNNYDLDHSQSVGGGILLEAILIQFPVLVIHLYPFGQSDPCLHFFLFMHLSLKHVFPFGQFSSLPIQPVAI